MDNYLAQLGDIDRKINILLLDKEINSEEITELVDTRDQILQVLVDYASKMNALQNLNSGNKLSYQHSSLLT